MRILSVYGSSRTGKTTTIEQLIRELHRRGFSVGSVKEIHNQAFQLDQAGTNTDRHRAAGAQLVTARGLEQTGIFYQEKRSIPDILKHYSQDFVICEGVTDYNMPKIITGSDPADLKRRWQKGIFAVSGLFAAEHDQYQGLPAINALTEIEKLADLVQEKALPLLTDVDPACCQVCGTNCRDFCDDLLQGRRSLADCVQQAKAVEIYINDQPLDLVPFVQDMIGSALRGMVSQLRGYQERAEIKVIIKGESHVRLPADPPPAK